MWVARGGYPNLCCARLVAMECRLHCEEVSGLNGGAPHYVTRKLIDVGSTWLL